MILPEKMTELTIFLNRHLIPVFLSDIVKIKNFHIEKIKDEYEDSDDDDSILDTYDVSSIISAEKLAKFMEKTELIQHYINELIKKGDINPNKIKSPNKDERINFEFIDYNNFIDALIKEVEELYYNIDDYSEKLKSIETELENLAIIISLINIISKFGGSNYKKEDFKRLHFELYTASKEHFNAFKDAAEHLKSPIVLYGEEIGPDIFGFFIFHEKVYEKKYENLFATYNCRELNIPKEFFDENGISITKIQSKHDELVKTRNFAEKSYKDQIKILPQKLLAYFETLENTITVVNIIKEFHNTTSHNIVRIQGFIPTSIKDDLINALQTQFDTNIRIDSKEIERKNPYEVKTKLQKEEEILKGEVKEPPTLLKLSLIAKPFHGLVKLYGRTNYSEIDPSIFLTISFPIIFGLMFGDVGHGVILSIIGLYAAIKFSKESKPKMYSSIMILLCGFGAIFGGLAYGENFGGHLLIGGEYFVLFASPLESITSVLKLSVIVGVTLISLGWMIKFVNLWINNRKFLGFADPLVKIIMIIGGTKLLLTYSFNIAAWLAPPEPILMVVIPSLFLIIMKPIGKLCGISYLQHESYVSLIGESGMDFAETMLQIISNVASFVRILALEMAHIGLMIVILEINAMVGDSILGTFILHPMILIFGNAFVIGLELILVMIHALRLHFYEFFSKFYVADGYEFDPVDISEDFSVFSFKDLPNTENCLNFNCNF